MCNVSLGECSPRVLGSIGTICLLLLGGCATTYKAPYQYKVEGPAGPPTRLMEQRILPPGAVVSKDTVTFVVEHDDANPSCLLLPEINIESLGRISSVYWRDIGKRGTRIDVDLKKLSCKTDEEGLRKCMRKAGAIAMDGIINASPEWATCWKPSPYLEPSYPYTARESLEEDLGFVFVPRSSFGSPSKSIEVETVETKKSASSSAMELVMVKTQVSEHAYVPDEVSSVNLRPGMKICVQAELSLTPNNSNRARQGTPENCARFVDGVGDLLAFPRIDQLASTVYAPFLNAHKTVAIYGVYDWSGIRSHAIEALGNTFQLTVYYPRVQAMNDTWTPISGVFMIENGSTTQAGPLVLLSGTKRVLPEGRQIQLDQFCGEDRFSCFLFMNRPSVRITQDIRLDQQVLEAELGMTLGELAASKSLPPVEISRHFRGRPIPVKGNADQVPLVRGDALRSLHD